MGACSFRRAASGKDAEEAYNDARLEAQSERGHQGGYSGDLNSKAGYLLVTPPPDVELSQWLNILRNCQLPKGFQMHVKEFSRQSRIYHDKWGPALCFEVLEENQPGSERKYIFVGFAPE